jgi:hypothetical protein
MGSAAKVMPRSSRNPRISLISAVRRCSNRSRTIQRWKFEPGRTDGIAVAVLVNVEVNFRLY